MGDSGKDGALAANIEGLEAGLGCDKGKTGSKDGGSDESSVFDVGRAGGGGGVGVHVDC